MTLQNEIEKILNEALDRNEIIANQEDLFRVNSLKVKGDSK